MSRPEPTFTTVVLIGLVVMLLISVVVVALDRWTGDFGGVASGQESPAPRPALVQNERYCGLYGEIEQYTCQPQSARG